MTEATESLTPERAPAGYRLGDPIALEDLLALPPDGRRYTRDREGRLELMAPDDPHTHRAPLACLMGWLYRSLDPGAWFPCQEPGVAFERIWTRGGRLLPSSRLGPRTLEPDAVVFAGRPGYIQDERGRPRGFDARAVRLVIEVLSRGTHRQDLGLARRSPGPEPRAREQVDRRRSYLDSGVPEYWILNPTDATLALPPRSGLFLRRGDAGWEPLAGEGLTTTPGAPVHGGSPVTAGRLASLAVPGLVFDADAFWRDAAGPQQP